MVEFAISWNHDTLFINVCIGTKSYFRNSLVTPLLIVRSLFKSIAIGVEIHLFEYYITFIEKCK